MKLLPDRFSIQGCEAKEGVSVPSKRRKPRADDAFGTPLFTRRPAPLGAGLTGGRLSIGHNDTNSEIRPVREAASNKTFKVWRHAALAQTPGIPNHNPSLGPQARPKTKRGKILSMSESSRRNLQTQLAKIRSDADLWTMCLSLPGHSGHFTHKTVKLAFLRWGKMLTAMSARDSRFRELAGFWKQELQKRNQLHFHILFSGVSESTLPEVWKWAVEKWILCVMDIPGMPPEFVESQSANMRKVHMHPKNFEKIRSNFHAYFAKYLGKDLEAYVAEFEIPGRWWGKFNSARIPWGKLQELDLPKRVAVHAQRVARKIRQARADDAKHRALCRRFDMMEGNDPTVSRMALQNCFDGLQAVGGVKALAEWCEARDARLPLSLYGRPLVLLLKAFLVGVSLKSLLAGCKFPPATKFSSVRLIGSHVPEMMLRVVQYAGQRALIDREQTPF